MALSTTQGLPDKGLGRRAIGDHPMIPYGAPLNPFGEARRCPWRPAHAARGGCARPAGALSSTFDRPARSPEAPMRPAACVLALSLALLAGLAPSPGQKPQAPNVVTAPPKSPADKKKASRLPPGFEAQLVAAEPDIAKPMNLAFDDQGRLWVTDSVEYPFPAHPPLKYRDTVKILSDFGPDGRARKVSTFAGGLNIPIGLLPLPAAKPQDALVYSIASVWRMRDSKGAGRADQRKVLYSGYGYRDTHGMTSAFTWGFDGWVYACH